MARIRPHRWLFAPILATTSLASVALARPFVARGDGGGGDSQGTVCEKTAHDLMRAKVHEAFDEYWVGIANCINIEDPQESRACSRENRQALDEALDLLNEQYQARLDLCDLLGGGAYDPQIDPDDFVATVSNPYFPLHPGQTLVYETETEEGTEHIEVTTTHDTREILGVECVVVHDVVTLEGELEEDTLDYYAQDRWGNVWYFGEVSFSYTEELPSLEGSWLAGLDGARPGIIMEAAPTPGDAYRQEFLANEAEDAASVTGAGRTVNVPFGGFSQCLETLEFTPLEPDLFASKFYAPGVGVVLELEEGERTELIAIF